jgi:hypothetical protein
LLTAVGHLFGTGWWYVGTVLTNPTAGTVLIDSGPLYGQSNSYLIGVMGASTVNWAYDVQHRNAANDTNIHAQRRRPSAGNEDWNSPNKILVGSNERIRLVLLADVTGEIQVSLFLQEVG